MSKSRILIAAGGTGGHLFPAQACGEELIQKNVEVLFAGAGLKTNRFFQTNTFAFAETSEAKRSVLAVMKGIFKSFSILRKFRPEIVVGFGSFHSFPLLVAARVLRIPIVIFESNSFPGKVNRWFSKTSALSCVQFAEAARHLKGKTEEVKTPLWRKSTT
ncbi:MAG TPA: glycosyltransferase, partial [Rhabdochlamydiaceae bacterium]